MPIIWEDFESWNDLVVETLTSETAEAVLSKVKQGDCDYVNDDPTWFNLLADNLDIPIEFVELKLAEKLSDNTVRVYHGCRPVDLSSYINHGLQIHDPKVMTNSLNELVQKYPQLLSLNLEDQIQNTPRDYDQHKSFLTFDKRYMIEYAGHYLIYGSEWISAVLGEKYRDILLEQGTPTLLLIDLPGSMIPSVSLRSLAHEMLREWIRLTITGKNEVIPQDFGVELDINLDSQHIVGHEHPKVIKDPTKDRIEYIVINKCCP